MPQPLVTTVWALLALVAGAAAVQRRRPPVQHAALPAVALGAAFGAAAALGGLSAAVQGSAAVITALALHVVAWRWRALTSEDRLPAGVGGRRLVGTVGTVVSPIRPEEPGRVHVLGDDWPATTTGEAIPVGADALVERVEGIRLHVIAVPRPAAPDTPEVPDTSEVQEVQDEHDHHAGPVHDPLTGGT